MDRVGRNDPCPCGSGKKYKKCCLADTFVQVGREESIRKRLVDALLEFYRKQHTNTIEEAKELFWGEFVPQKYLEGHAVDIAYQNFFEWITFDFIIDPDANKTLIDLYIEHNRKLTQDEHAVLTKMKNSCISLYEVQEVFPEKGLLLKDLLMGGEYDVKEKAATRGLKRWDIFATRLLLIDGQHIMSGAAYPYHLKMKQWILEDIAGEYEDYKQEFPDATMDQFLKENSDIFNFYWYDPIQNPPPLKMQNTSGEALLFSKAVFEIRDKDAVVIGLPKIKGFEQDQEGYVWHGKKAKGGGKTIYGNLEIKGSRLTLETNSKKRLEQGKKLIIEGLGDAIVHKADSYQDPMEAIKSHKGKSTHEPKDTIPMDVKQEVYDKFMKDHCERWLKDKIPALDGMTPMEAIKTEAGREKVRNLLKLFENSEERNKSESQPCYDLSWMWERLGLERE
jgi:hypothetical protein